MNMNNEKNIRFIEGKFSELDINEMDLWIDDEKTGKERFIVDGFNLTELNIVERQIFKENYIDENSLSNFYLARKKVNELKKHPDIRKNIANPWGFPTDGRYLGYVIECRATEDKNQYILNFLISDNIICLSKFQKSVANIVYTSIVSFFNIKDNVFRSYDFSQIPVFPAEITVENIALKDNKKFSVVKDFRILKNDEAEILAKAADIILG